MKKTLILMTVLLLSISLFSKMEEYDRKSISILKTDVSPVARSAKKEYVDLIHRKVANTFTAMKRFDFNPVPAGVSDPDKLFSIVKEYAKTKIEERAGKQWNIKNDYYGSNFVTAENVDKIINGAYLLFPTLETLVITEKKEKKDGKTKKITNAALTVSVDVYAAENKGTSENPNWIPHKVKTISASGSSAGLGFGSLLSAITDNGKGNTKKKAVAKAADGMVLFLEKELKKMDIFKIKALVTKAEPRRDNIEFNFGKEVGVNLDDAYMVGYYQKNKAGKEKFVETGFMKVRDIKTRQTSAQLLIVTNPRNEKESDLFNEYDQVIEYPLVGLNVVVGGGIAAFKSFDGIDEMTGELEDKTSVASFGVTMEYNVAKMLKISEFYMVMNADYFAADQDFGNDLEPDVTALVYELGFIKKHMNRRFAFYWGASFGYETLKYELEDDYNSIEEDYTAIGGKGVLGINYLFGKTVFFDLQAGYRFYSELRDEDGDDVFENSGDLKDEGYLTPSGIVIKAGLGFTL